MTTFKELRRIERAIEHREEAELRWAAEYCRMRLQYVRDKQGESPWRKLENRVRQALAED